MKPGANRSTWAWKCCMKCETNCPVLFHRNIHFTETPHIYICILSFRTPLPLGEINGDFAAKFIWACAFLFVHSLAGKIFLFKIVKMNLINSRREKSPQLSDNQNTNFQLCHQINFHQINRRWLLIIWTLSTYLHMFFQL